MWRKDPILEKRVSFEKSRAWGDETGIEQIEEFAEEVRHQVDGRLAIGSVPQDSKLSKLDWES